MAAPAAEQWHRELERHVRETLQTIRYGTVTLVVQDGIVIQIEKSEKIRLARPGHVHGSGI